MKYIGKTSALFLLFMGTVGNVTHAQAAQQGIFSSSINSTLRNAAADGTMRNELVTDRSIQIRGKETALVNELTSSLLSLENIQTRIAAKTAEINASGTDVTSINTLLASSSDDIIAAENAISLFASSTTDESSVSISQKSIIELRKLAQNAIDSVNATHSDLQSALNALTSVL